LGSGPF